MSFTKRSQLLFVTAISALALAACSDQGADEHAGMNHEGMDHASMDHGSMDHSGHEGMEMANANTPSYGAAEHVADFTLMGTFLTPCFLYRESTKSGILASSLPFAEMSRMVGNCLVLGLIEI